MASKLITFPLGQVFGPQKPLGSQKIQMKEGKGPFNDTFFIWGLFTGVTYLLFVPQTEMARHSFCCGSCFCRPLEIGPDKGPAALQLPFAMQLICLNCVFSGPDRERCVFERLAFFAFC